MDKKVKTELEENKELTRLNPKYLKWRAEVLYTLTALIGVGILLIICLFKLL